ncbi:unnamed protein product [Acanthoscelides obtectus]|uniref:Uncharacterized protein n=1 Tax=Acanthoscelides obtectus TaxID=200917 RepID=A0A9P0KMQ8_ACAOB|nr:unnamed protein product [Acanthoscelides obtectus]CAK1626164.1 hypothetical protein AOBTE_LOCUS3656 [Acanthoscelides obtectus]
MPVALRRKRKYSGCCCSKRSSSASDVYQQNKNTQCQQCKVCRYNIYWTQFKLYMSTIILPMIGLVSRSFLRRILT